MSYKKNGFDYLKYSLVDFVDNFQGCAHIKETKNFTYIYSNMPKQYIRNDHVQNLL
jgi:hypothetical protein